MRVQFVTLGALVTTAKGAQLEGTIFGVWLTGQPTAPDLLPFLRGTQAVAQWAAVQPGPNTFNFSALDVAAQAALALMPAGRDPRLTVQINGNEHPPWMFDMLPACNNDTSTWAHENKDPRGVLQFWHPFFVQQYEGLLEALAIHLTTVSYRSTIAGIRMSWDAAGTESTGVPPDHRDPAQWIRPVGGLPAAAPYNGTTGLDYQRAVFRAHVAAFVTGRSPSNRTFLFVRNSLPIELRGEPVPLPDGGVGPATKLFDAGVVGWFHTSSEIEPRSGDSLHYTTFLQYCKDYPTTICYAEPWASAWGDHDGTRDPRWCSPPQWEYWRILSDLHVGVTYVALYGTDMQVAMNGKYPTASGSRVGPQYQCEFNQSFTFAATYAGSPQLSPSEAPGAWIAFRSSVSPLNGYNVNVSDYFQLLARDPVMSVDFEGLDARRNGTAAPIISNQTIAGLFTIGPYWQRYGAWARVLRGTTGIAVLRLNAAFAQSLVASQEKPSLRLVHLAMGVQKNTMACRVTVKVGGKSLPLLSIPTGPPAWNEKVWPLPSDVITGLIKTLTIQLESSCDVVLHMVEISRSFPSTTLCAMPLNPQDEYSA